MIFTCFTASSCLCLSGCSASSEEPDNEAEVADNTLVDANPGSDSTSSGFRLFAELTKQEGIGENVFISPTSIAIALAMTYDRAEGETQQAMAEVLGLKGDHFKPGARHFS